MKLEEFLKKEYNYNPNLKEEMQTYIDQWKSWYTGKVKSFHNYNIYNGQKMVKQERYSLGMAKEISEDWSDIEWSEKCSVSMADDRSNKEFENIIDVLDLNVAINNMIESSLAKGTAGAVVSVYDIITNETGTMLDVTNAKLRLDLVDVDDIYPLSWDNKEITECAFSSVRYINGKKYVICSVHKIADNGNYAIYNHIFKDTNGNLTELLGVDDTVQVFDTMSNVKWFTIARPLLSNNISKNNPFGISIFANAIDCLKSVDIAYDAIKNEIIDNRKRTFVREELMNYDDGTGKLTFDENDITVYVLPKGATKDDLIQSDSESFRTADLIETLNTELNILGSKVGFGENHYHFDGQTLNTATSVVSSNSKMFRRKKKLEIGYESSIYDLVMAVCYAGSTFGNYNINTDGMVIQFDDSIIEDKEAESQRARAEVSLGVLSKSEYRQKVYGETKEIADKAIEEIKASDPSVQDLLGNE